MATPMTAQQFVDALKAEGAAVREVKGWRTNNRAGHGDWGPLNGVMIHHTAGGSDGAVEYCFNGSDELPGPLCQVVSTKDGVLHMVGNGRANHAGGGDPDVLDAVINERYPLPDTDKHQGEAGVIDGNARFYGVEAVNYGNGKDPWPDVQMDALVKFAAGICRFHGWSAKSVIGHKEWSDYKSDPTFNMTEFRARVQAKLDGSTVPPKPDPEPEPQKPTVSLRNLIDAALRDPGAAQGATTHKADVLLFERALAKLGYLDSQWVDGSFGTKTKAATTRLQQHLGYSGAGADGIPGNHSTTWLGLKTGLYRKVD